MTLKKEECSDTGRGRVLRKKILESIRDKWLN